MTEANTKNSQLAGDVKVSLWEKVAYGLGDTSCNILIGLTTGLLSFFYTDYIGVSIATVGYSCAPHLDMEKLLGSAQARKEFMHAIESRGLELYALNCAGNPIGPGPRWASHDPIIMDTLKLAEPLGVKHIVSHYGLPAGSPNDETLNWVTYSYPPEMMDVLEYQWEVAIKFWQKAAAAAKEHGVETIALENHPMNLVYNVPTVLRLREAVGDVIGLNLDPSHVFFMGGDPIMMARKLCEEKAIYHVHGKDSRINPFYKHPLLSKECEEEYRRTLKETGVEISSFICVYRWSGSTEEQRQMAVENWKKIIQIAVNLGVPVINTELSGDQNQTEICSGMWFRSMEELLPIIERELLS